MDDFSIVKAHPSMLRFIDQLQHRNAESLSFYPLSCFEREMEHGRLLLGLLNGQPCGYIYHGAGRDGNLRCHQICIEYDARRRLYGAALVSAMEEEAESRACHAITLRCGFDLEANDFWAVLGYGVIDVVDGGARRMRRINIWQKRLDGAFIETRPAERGVTSSTQWRKHKQTGLVTQFHRGPRLAEYRAIVAGGIDENPSTL